MSHEDEGDRQKSETEVLHSSLICGIEGDSKVAKWNFLYWMKLMMPWMLEGQTTGMRRGEIVVYNRDMGRMTLLTEVVSGALDCDILNGFDVSLVPYVYVLKT